MLDTRVKICGITTPEDAKLSFSLGADYLGLIFADSVRRVTPEQAQAIRTAVPQALLVGVFMDAPIDEVVDTSRACGINMVQLHGDESPEYCDTLMSQLSLPIIKAFASPRLPDTNRLREYSRASYFLFDLDKNYAGESKINGEHDHLWTTAATLRRKGFRIFLAGKLGTDNVRAAVKRVAPYCVDVATGVESAPGVKDSRVLRAFIKELRG